MTTPVVPPDDSFAERVRNGSGSDAMGSKPDTWTRWFDVDTPTHGYNNGDYETVYRIQRTYKICDKDYEITAAECSINGDPLTTFTEQTPKELIKDNLQRFCTTEGLVCANEDQPEGSICDDYSVRFRCHYTGDKDKDGSYPQFDVRIYIILAVVPILIFLLRMLWTYVCRRRRQQRRNQRRAINRLNRAHGDDYDDDSSSVASGVANPPPSYQELFGKTGHATSGSSVFAISRDNIPICQQCQRDSCSVASIIGKQRSSQHAPSVGQSARTGSGNVSQEQQTKPANEHESENGEEHTENSLTDVVVQVSSSPLVSTDAPISFSASTESHRSPSSSTEEAVSPSALAPPEEAISPSARTVDSCSPLAPPEEAFSPSAEDTCSPLAPTEEAISPSAQTVDSCSTSLLTDSTSSPPAPLNEAPCSSLVLTEELSLQSDLTEGLSSPSAATEDTMLYSDPEKTSDLPSSLGETPSSSFEMAPNSSLTVQEEPSTPSASTEVHISSSSSIETLSSSLASTETSISPLVSPEITKSPSTEATHSPLASTEATNSHLTSAEATDSSLVSIETTNSPLASAKVTSSPLSSEKATNSPFTSSEPASSSSVSIEVTDSPLTSTEILNPPLTLIEAPKPQPSLTDAPSSHTSKEAPISSSTPSSEAPPEIIIDITEADVSIGTAAQTSVLEVISIDDTQSDASATLDTNSPHTGSNQDQIYSQNNISETLEASSSSQSSDLSSSSDLSLSLNASLLNPADISDPCACPCHRTIPLKHHGATGYDNQGYAFDGDVEASRHASFPGMHIPVFGFPRVWSDLSVASSVAPADLPTYELAIELINDKKTKDAESQTRSN